MSTQPTPGRCFAGKFDVERVIAHGGVGSVYLAMHRGLEQNVAVKVLRSDFARDETQRARFEREARAAARLKSRHVTRILDVGRTPDDISYLVFEYLDGESLDKLLERTGPLAITTAVRYVLEVSEALAEAHALGVIHRDIKPSNVFLTRAPDGTPEIKVLDFGLAKLRDIERSTGSLQAVGTLEYMSPEQIRRLGDVDERGDIWSLGMSLFELLTGAIAFPTDDAIVLMKSIAQDPARAPSTLRRDVSTELDSIVLRCLEKNPAHRYSNVIELAVALAPFAGADAKETQKRLERIALEATARRPEPSPRAGGAPVPVAPPVVPPAGPRQTKTDPGGRVVAAPPPRVVASPAVASPVVASRDSARVSRTLPILVGAVAVVFAVMGIRTLVAERASQQDPLPSSNSTPVALPVPEPSAPERNTTALVAAETHPAAALAIPSGTASTFAAPRAGKPAVIVPTARSSTAPPVPSSKAPGVARDRQGE